MVLDFGVVKAAIGSVVDRWDHALLLEQADPILKMLVDRAPDLCIVEMSGAPTVELMCEQLLHDVRLSLAVSRVEVVSVRIYETPTCWAECKGA